VRRSAALPQDVGRQSLPQDFPGVDAKTPPEAAGPPIPTVEPLLVRENPTTEPGKRIASITFGHGKNSHFLVYRTGVDASERREARSEER
jgi:hypothetical protein